MVGNKYIILLLDDLSLEKKIKEVLSVRQEYMLLFSLDDVPLQDDSNSALFITTLLPSLGDNYNPLSEIRRKFTWINILVITEPENSFRIFETFTNVPEPFGTFRNLLEHSRTY
jgi:hypothetical protein